MPRGVTLIGRRLELPPTKLDLAAARAMAHRAVPALEHSIEPITWLADEKLVLGAAMAFWLAGRWASRDSRLRRCADQILLGAAVATLLPHGIKQVIARERPDRKVVGFIRHGIPRSGNWRDSFPSGHAVELGALASAGSRMIAGPTRLLVWPAALALASTRLVLLAHYLTDVLAGLFFGVAIDRLLSRKLQPLLTRVESRATRSVVAKRAPAVAKQPREPALAR